MLLGIDLARDLGASEVELVGDSELIVKQVRGEYKVKKADLRPLRDEVRERLREFDDWSIRHVRREQNEAADLLVNETLDALNSSPRAAVAQLARASACHAEGRGFESHQPLRTKAPLRRGFLR